MTKGANTIADIAGLRVGQAHDKRLASGVTVVVFDAPNVASGVVRGGAPGTRDVAVLEPEMSVESIDAVVLSGGSAFGLDAAGGVMAVLRDQGRGIKIHTANFPIVVQAITFDLLNGGDKAWGQKPPYWDLGLQAALAAQTGPLELGSVGGGYGATTATFKGGVGSASAVTASGFKVAALVIVNAVGSATIGAGPHFWAAGVERCAEFGGLGQPQYVAEADLALRIKGGSPPPPSTTIALVVTDARLTKPQAKRLAIMADDGLARAIRPAHAPMDGDTVVAVSMLQKPLTAGREAFELTELGMAAGDCLARSIARGVYEATALTFAGALPAWRDAFGDLVAGRR
ncbi:MAG: P1 family peptidase [Hyphomicrobiaceae bacterium]|nr:P1 family peptidase [Hyphomicrobiaceae bacterium]